MAYNPVLSYDPADVIPISVDGSSTAYYAGDLMAYNGSAWVKADADTPATLSAVGVLTRNIPSGSSATEPAHIARRCRIYDADAPYTAGALLYLSGTAGAHTATRPTTAAQLRQVVGVALTTEYAEIVVNPPREVDLPLEILETTSGESALGSRTALDSGLFEGIQLNAQNEHIIYGVRLPDNCISVQRAELLGAQESATGGGTAPTFDLTVNSVVAEAVWDAVTADTSETGKTLVTFVSDEVNVYEFSSALNATNIVRPGAFLAIKVNKADAGTVATLHFGGRLIVKVA